MSLNSMNAADLESGLNKDNNDKQTKDVKKDSISWIKRPCLWVALGKVCLMFIENLTIKNHAYDYIMLYTLKYFKYIRKGLKIQTF